MPTEDSRRVRSKSLAEATFSVRWSESDVTHEDFLHFERFSVWRDIDTLPHALASQLLETREGMEITCDVNAGDLVQTFDPLLTHHLPNTAFDRNMLSGRVLTPALGRFYPRGFFHDHAGIFREEWLPTRIIGLGETTLTIDMNHPLARYPLKIGLIVDRLLPETDMRGGKCNDCMGDLLRNPGMSAGMDEKGEVDFSADDAMQRFDQGPDDRFYCTPRMVQHLDARALETVARLYARLLSGKGRVLDLMGSFDSHLDLCQPEYLSVLGMNATELTANPFATERTVHDLNNQPKLPYPDNSFNGVVCTASIEYLIDPVAVLREVRRVLRPGGLMVSTFSNRWFPGKAIRIWSDLHEFERLGMVTQWYRKAGFTELHNLSARGWRRPTTDVHAATQQLADPVFAVWGSTGIK